MKCYLFYFATVFLYAILPACSMETDYQKGFYHWTSGEMSVFEEHVLQESGTNKVYLKLFEVSMDELEGAIPMDKIYGKYPDSFFESMEIVPCIFIENEVIARSTDDELEELAENVVFLTEKYLTKDIKENENTEVNWKEIQIDCDWIKSSKTKYFTFLKALKKHTDKQLSCTLRLYPYKFQKEMGVPPVDRAMLLCYNLSNPQTNEDLNTILDMGELKKYLQGGKPYPLPLDVGIPMYSSCYKFTNGHFDEVIHSVPEGLESVCLPSDDGLWYTLRQDTTIDYNHFRKGQHIKIERVSNELLEEACTLIREYVPLEKDASIAIYHLNESELKKYDHETVDAVFHLFSQR